ncbi:hypothetical protein EK21DRAFT_100963 [Setomelanomma holmii]|uniref:Nephrocystin 3-like N-terminal domain-containing protein n=1 Tax=Setomelanomma holmii TaxID=210430 RepID=A0A9P4H7V5_9PLEO|nr:hypothetical protein EK21DRAFT_100963 [Setomelanomma holmii]
MESLAAIGLAGNIVQFISFSSILISKSREIHKSASGVTSDTVDLKLISKDLRKFSSRVLSSNNSNGPYAEIATQCDEVAKTLLAAIKAIETKRSSSGPRDRPSKWQSFRKALKYVWLKDQIEDLKSRLEMLRGEMMMHMMSESSRYQRQVTDLLADREQRDSQDSRKINNQIRGLDSHLQGIQANFAHMHTDAYWTKLHDVLADVNAKVQQVSQWFAIIASLRYEYMELRQEAITYAHTKTFDWIFHPCNFEPSDPRSGIQYTKWLQQDSGIYWVTGKPGSGKSTLMKHLYDHVNTTRFLRVWAGGLPLVRASFFFWNPGQQMQKSLEGLLRTLLYHMLRACPELTSVLCPARWNTSSSLRHIDLSTPWTLAELREAFAIYVAQCSVTTKFYFHVDGLDEYYGDSWEVIDTLRKLSAAPNVKICLSSRPWNAFQDAFGGSMTNMLRLHDLTRDDIELFARENLQNQLLHIDFEPQLFESLVQDIGDRAHGVFLWVRLAVRSLRDGLTNEDPLSILHERLRAISSDLEQFFEQILESVDTIYRTRMANTFMAALRTDRPLKIIHYYLLEQGETTCNNKLPEDQWSEFEIQRKVHQTHRRLNGRFKGLLEPASGINLGPQTTLIDQNITVNLDRVLKHAITFELLLHCGANPKVAIDGSSALQAFLDRMCSLMDTADGERIWNIFLIFLNKQFLTTQLTIDPSVWHCLLTRLGNTTVEASCNTLHYFRRLFLAGLDPNIEAHGVTTTTMFFHTLVNGINWEDDTAHDYQMDLLREFLRHGADITKVYETQQDRGWLESVRIDLLAWGGNDR